MISPREVAHSYSSLMIMNRKVFQSNNDADDNYDNDDDNDNGDADDNIDNADDNDANADVNVDDNVDDNDAQPVLEPCSLQWEQPYREVHKCAHLPRLTIKTITNKDAAIFLLIIEEKVDLADKVN